MDKYVFDTNCFIVIFTHFYKSRFPSLWENFDDLIAVRRIVSVREVANEINQYYKETRLTKWVKGNPQVFEQPTAAETSFVNKIFEHPHFQNLISRKNILEGKPAADPFIIAKAKIIDAYVVTQEEYRKNAAKIPNVCKYFAVPFITLEAFMEKENWRF